MIRSLKHLLKQQVQILRKLRDNAWLSGISIALLSTVFTLVISTNVSLARLAENYLSDVRVAMFSIPRLQSRNIAIALIDDITLAHYPYRSPLDRSLITDLLVQLEGKSVAAIGINVLFDRPTEPEKDRLLYEQLRKASVPVVVSKISTTSDFSADRIRYSNEFLKDLRTGVSMIYRDPIDHIIRGSFLKQVQGSTIELGFAATLAVALGVDLPSEEQVFIDYRSGPDPSTLAFPVYGAHEIADLPLSALQNKIVLIGADLVDSSHLRTPLSVLNDRFNSDLPGVVIEAHILSQLIESRSMKFASTQEGLLFSFFMALLGCILSLMPGRLAFKLIFSLVLLPLSWLGAFSLYTFQQTIVPMVMPTMAFIVAAIISAFWEWRREFDNRELINKAFEHFLSPTIVKEIILDPGALELGGEEREISFVFTDLEGFTNLTESTPPKQMVRLVNRYLDEACDIVMEHGGTIDKIVGDALHTMFNAPVLQEDHALRAVRCALALDTWSENFRKLVKAEEDIGLGCTRIGINTGNCIVGNFGGKRRFDYTAYGDAINTAARLEAINKRLGTRICISESTVKQCHGIHFRPVANLLLRGKTIGLNAFTAVVENKVDCKLSESYEEAYRALSDNDEKVDDLFAALETLYPEDPLVRLHVRRIKAGETGTKLIAHT